MRFSIILKPVLFLTLLIFGSGFAQPAMAGGGGIMTEFNGKNIKANVQLSSFLIGRINISGAEPVNNLQFVCTPSQNLQSIIVKDFYNHNYEKSLTKSADGLYRADFLKPNFKIVSATAGEYQEKQITINVYIKLKDVNWQPENIYCSLNYIDLISSSTGEILHEERNAVFINNIAQIRLSGGAKNLSSLNEYFRFANKSYKDTHFYLGEIKLSGTLSSDCPALNEFFSNWKPAEKYYCFKVPKTDPALRLSPIPLDRYDGDALEFWISASRWPRNIQGPENFLNRKLILQLANIQTPTDNVYFMIQPTVTGVEL